ncbi:MAG: translation initiation factor IF-2, partial [Proteobacteria bacterium]|nr:translation initiation factor IF-2 [Pseudomonadota bacterium]
AESVTPVEEPVAETVETTEPPTPEATDAAAKTPAAAASDEDDKPKKKKKKARKKQEAPQVRIISMPNPAEVAAAKAAAELLPKPKPVARDTAPIPGEPIDSANASRKKGGRKKGRVVEFARDDRGGGAGRHEREIPGNDFGGRGGKRKKGKRRGNEQQQPDLSQTQPLKATKRKIKVDEAIRLADMAHQMGTKAQDLIKTLFGLGVMATINQSLDMDTATVLAAEFGYEVENVSFDEQEFLVPTEVDSPESLKPRPPVVTIMGHVDHGKTSLLDAIRKSNVTGGEAGGITQHIGAYHVSTGRGEIVFLDTPGHEAFTTMRMRGAQVTDLVILVVAADDGVMDQTREAISHARAAGVPLLVAVNKIDKEGANPDRVTRELSDQGLVPEDWGGDTIFAHVSAKEKIGLDELLEMVLLQAEVLELSANPDKPGQGHIVEAKLDRGRGPVGTVLIKEGTIHQGDSFVCGMVHGKVRAMFTDQGKKIKKAGPAIPVEIQGFDAIAQAGDDFVVVADDKVAKRIAEARAVKHRDRVLAGKSKVTLESFLASKPDDQAQDLNLVLKADVQGSLEAVTEALNKLSTGEVKIQVRHSGTGAINESDILLASASQAVIIGFNVRPEAKIKAVADQENVEIRYYDIIYKLVDEVKDAMSGMLAPDIEEVYLGQAEVRETFSVPKVGTVAGCGVVDGKLTRHAKIRLLRGGVVIYTGSLTSLRRFKDDAKEVAKGFECGVGLEKYNDIKIGDIIEAFEEKEVARSIDGK